MYLLFVTLLCLPLLLVNIPFLSPDLVSREVSGVFLVRDNYDTCTWRSEVLSLCYVITIIRRGRHQKQCRRARLTNVPLILSRGLFSSSWPFRVRPTISSSVRPLTLTWGPLLLFTFSPWICYGPSETRLSHYNFDVSSPRRSPDQRIVQSRRSWILPTDGGTFPRGTHPLRPHTPSGVYGYHLPHLHSPSIYLIPTFKTEF